MSLCTAIFWHNTSNDDTRRSWSSWGVRIGIYNPDERSEAAFSALLSAYHSPNADPSTLRDFFLKVKAGFSEMRAGLKGAWISKDLDIFIFRVGQDFLVRVLDNSFDYA
jgi:hypothetical protein